MQSNYFKEGKQINKVIYINHIQKISQLNIKTKIYQIIENLIILFIKF